MTDWNPKQYLKFESQRTQPAIDLAKHISDLDVKNALDIGCGPGNSTNVLKKYFPVADITGIDSSEDMIKKAQTKYPAIPFEKRDALDICGMYDLLFSNACLQWIPDHDTLIPYFMEHLNDGGTLAVQVPMNGEEPLYKIIGSVTSDAKWGFDHTSLETNEILTSAEYYGILSSCSSDFDIWETVYYHSMPSHESLIEWVRSTRLRPYLAQLDDDGRAEFENELLDRVKSEYRVTSAGDIIFRFRRLFFTARR